MAAMSDATPPQRPACIQRTAPGNEHCVQVFGVPYAVRHMPLGDLYLTRYGWPLRDALEPERWYAEHHYSRAGDRLHEGTGTVYRLPSRDNRGRRVDFVVKFSRFAQDVPLHVPSTFPDESITDEDVANAYFLSPFEEFGRLMELRESGFGPPGLRILTKRPLAIFCPSEQFQPWQLGRNRSRFRRDASSIEREQFGSEHVSLHSDRDYVVIFHWVRGENAAEYAMRGLLDPAELGPLTTRVTGELQAKGFRVLDNKPQHYILRLGRDGRLVRRGGELAYTLIDFELLERTPAYEQWLDEQSDRSNAG